MPRVDLTGRTIAITGASSGIGRATALACAEAGMNVALNARREDRLREVGREVEARGRSAVVVPGDLAERGRASAFVAEAVERLGRLDAVFANAGFGFERATLDCDESDLRHLFEVNFWSSYETVRAAIGPLSESDAGHALLCSSCLSKIGIPYYAAYCATKAAQDHFGRALRLELRPLGLAVSTVHPIGTRTEFFDQAKARSGGSTLMDRTPKAALQTPERVARAIVRRLRSGRGGEVWTSLTTRLLLAGTTAFPGLTDVALARMVDRRRRRD